MATLAQPSPAAHVDRPRAHSNLSFTSNTSRRSRGSKVQVDMTESPNDKKKFNTESKADPTKALNEATPAQVAQQETNLEDLRRTSWKDQNGDVITDPDRSNPTRPRMERPLDTIRSFAAAAEGTANRRSSSYGSFTGRPQSQYGEQPLQSHSRQSSYYNSPGAGPRSYGRPSPGGGYYRNSSYGFNGYPTQNSFDESAEYDQRDYYRPEPPRGGPGMRNRNPANPYYGNPNEMQGHTTHQPSYDNMTSGSDENSKSTNPSSLNSSYDQLHMAQHAHARKPDAYPQNYQNQQNQYDNEVNFAPVSPVSPQVPNGHQYAQNGTNGGGSPGQYYPSGQQNGNGYYPRQQNNPAPPPKDPYQNGGRVPIRLDGPPSAPSSGAAHGNILKKSNDDGNKRKSWLSRKFSKKEK